MRPGQATSMETGQARLKSMIEGESADYLQ